LGIIYLIHAYTPNDQHKEPQQQPQWGQQQIEQLECQPTVTASTYAQASASYANTNASDYAADHGQHAGCSTSRTTTNVKG
jgi:hypothetical protein